MKLVKILIIMIFILTIMNSVKADFLIDLDIPIQHLSVKPGDDMSVNVKIINIGEISERNDYNLKMNIFDANDNKIYEKSKLIAIENEVNTLFEFNLPEKIEPGEYTAIINLNGNKKSAGFIVNSKNEYFNDYIVYWLILIGMVFLIVLIVYERKLNKLVKDSQRIRVKDIIRRKRRWK